MADSTVSMDTTPEATTENTPAAENTATSQATPPTTNGLPDDPAELKNMVHKLRAENAKDRTNAKAQAAAEARDERGRCF